MSVSDQQHLGMKKAMRVLAVMNGRKLYQIGATERVYWKFVLNRIKRDHHRALVQYIPKVTKGGEIAIPIGRDYN